MRHIKLCIKENNDSHIKTPTELTNLLKQRLAVGDLRTIEAADTALSTETITAEVDCSVSDGIRGGCYGARDGHTYKGLTLWIDHTELPDQWKDEDGEITINILSHIENCEGEQLELGCCPAEDLNLQLLSEGNTYNNNSGNYLSANINYSIYDLGNAVLLEAEVHCGGDIRGNYSSPIYFKFEAEGEALCALYPLYIDAEEQET